MELADCTRMLCAFYMLEVERRGKRFELDEQTEHAISAVAAALCAKQPRFGIMLCGVCGNGKSTMMRALQAMLNHLNNSGFFNYMGGGYHVGLRIKDALDVTRLAKQEDQWYHTKTATQLAIDDMGKEPKEVMDYGNVLSPIVELIEYRYEAMLWTVISTNLTPKQISEKYGARVADRFSEMLEVVVFGRRSYRREQQPASAIAQEDISR